METQNLHELFDVMMARAKSKSLMEGRCPRNPGAATAITTPSH